MPRAQIKDEKTYQGLRDRGPRVVRLAQLRRPAAPAAVLVLGGVVGLEGGAVVAATIIPAAGIAGTVMLRLGFESAGLIAIGRPSLRGLDRRAVLLVLAVPPG